LLVWIAVEIAIVGYSNQPPLQAFYLALGIVIMLVGIAWLLRTGIPYLRRPSARGEN
jgi:high-affinity Fe2+/Pb2+ permease